VYTGAPAGEYRLEVQLYVEEGSDGRQGGRPLGTAELGTVAVQASDRFWSGEIAGFRPIPSEGANGWQLMGVAGSDRVATGERAYVTTVWRAGGATGEQRLRFVAADGRVVSMRSAALEGPAGSLLRVQLAPPIGAGWAVGEYRVEIALVEGWRELGRLRVEPGAAARPAAEPAVPLDAVFGGVARLRGYSSAVGGVTLHWEAVGEIDRSLHVFVHLLGADGAIAGQSVGPPGDGKAPTDGWAVGDRVDDTHRFSVPAGEYRVIVGLYEPGTGSRLLAGDGTDHVDLGRLRLGG
jgi:hypothetical protein